MCQVEKQKWTFPNFGMFLQASTNPRQELVDVRPVEAWGLSYDFLPALVNNLLVCSWILVLGLLLAQALANPADWRSLQFGRAGHLSREAETRDASAPRRISLSASLIYPVPGGKVFSANMKLVYILRALEWLILTKLNRAE